MAGYATINNTRFQAGIQRTFSDALRCTRRPSEFHQYHTDSRRQTASGDTTLACLPCILRFLAKLLDRVQTNCRLQETELFFRFHLKKGVAFVFVNFPCQFRTNGGIHSLRSSSAWWTLLQAYDIGCLLAVVNVLSQGKSEDMSQR